MSERTSIEWCHHTFNPWWGCTEVSPGCDNCYARTWAQRFGVKWGVGQVRKPASERTWTEPLKWEAKAAKDGMRHRVFCASMADVFDNEGLPAERERLWSMIEMTPNLDWLLLTKRIGNALDMIPKRWLDSRLGLPRNIWIGATVVNQDEAVRDIPKLLLIRAAVRFLSCEPMLGLIDARPYFRSGMSGHPGVGLGGFNCAGNYRLPPSISWVIAGGESGSKARAANPDWIRSLRDQCIDSGVSFFFKQWGEWVCDGDDGMIRVGKLAAGRNLDGRTWDEFPRSAA